MKIGELAKKYGPAHKTLAGLCAAEKIPGVIRFSPKGDYHIEEADYVAWLKSQKKPQNRIYRKPEYLKGV